MLFMFSKGKVIESIQNQNKFFQQRKCQRKIYKNYVF
jgi:hypothetical protein